MFSKEISIVEMKLSVVERKKRKIMKNMLLEIILLIDILLDDKATKLVKNNSRS